MYTYIQRNGKEYGGFLHAHFSSALQVTDQEGHISKIANHNWFLRRIKLISFEKVDVYGRTEYREKYHSINEIFWKKKSPSDSIVPPSKEPISSSWTPVNSGLMMGRRLGVTSLAVSGSAIFAGTWGRRCLSFHQQWNKLD